MITRKFTDEELMQAIEEGLNNRDCAKRFGCDESSIRSRRRKLGIPASTYAPSNCPEGHVIDGLSTCVDAEGNVKQQWIKTKVDNQQAIIDMYKNMFAELSLQLPRVESKSLDSKIYIDEDLMAVLPLGDPHIGMLAWNAETRGGNWDLQIAENTLCNIFHTAVQSVPRCGTLLIVNLGDLLHYDNQDGVTSRSKNILDRDGRYAKMAYTALRVMRSMIDTALNYHNKVEVINATGNHDEIGSIWMRTCLAAIYEKESRVSINVEPSLFHYKQFGKVLLGVHHGHTCKVDKLPSVMAAKEFKKWGETEFRYWLTGHVHHDSLKEPPGCKVETFRTLAAPDSYATAGGWVSGRDQKTIVYHKDMGEVFRTITNIKQYMKTIEWLETNDE